MSQQKDPTEKIYLKLDELDTASGATTTPDALGGTPQSLGANASLINDDTFGRVVQFDSSHKLSLPFIKTAVTTDSKSLSVWSNTDLKKIDLINLFNNTPIDLKRPVDAWHNYAVVIDDHHQHFYIDGTLHASVVARPTFTAEAAATAAQPKRFAHMRVYEGVLTAAQIEENLSADKLNPPSDLIDIESNLVVDLPLNNVVNGTTKPAVNSPTAIFGKDKDMDLIFDETMGQCVYKYNVLDLSKVPRFNNVTASIWFKLIDGYHFIWGIGLYKVHITSSYTWFESSTLYTTFPQLKPNNWYHLTAVMTSNDTWFFYVDGVEQTGTKQPQPNDVSTNEWYVNSDTTSSLNTISMLRIYERALSPAEIKAVRKADMARVQSKPTANPLHVYYRLDEAAGQDSVADLSGNKWDGTLTADKSSFQLPTDAFRSLNKAATVEFQAKSGSTAVTWFSGITQQLNQKGTVLALPVDANGHLAPTAGYNLSKQTPAPAITAYNKLDADLKTDHHWALVRDVTGQTLTIYRDGEIFGKPQTGLDATNTLQGITQFTVNKKSVGYFRLWGKALTEAQIKQHVQSEKQRQAPRKSATQDPSLLLYLKLDNYDEDIAQALDSKSVTDYSQYGRKIDVKTPPIAMPAGQLGGCFGFTAKSQISASDLGTVKSLSLGFWLQFDPKSPPSTRTLIHTPNLTLTLEKSASSDWQISGYLGADPTKAPITPTQTTINDGQWHYISTIVDETAKMLTFFVDSLQDSQTSLQSAWLGLGKPVQIGNTQANGNGHGMTWKMSHLRLFNKVLQPADLQALMKSDQSSLGAFRMSHPLNFSWHNEKQEQALYITDTILTQLAGDEKERHQFALSLTNTSTKDIVLQSLGKGAALANDIGVKNGSTYHFQLRFRPNTISANSVDAIRILLQAAQGAKPPYTGIITDQTGQKWVMAYGQNPIDQVDWISLIAPKESAPFKLPAQATHEVLPGRGSTNNFVPLLMAAATAGGARSTRIHLKYDHLCYADGAAVPSGTRSQMLGIVNHSGKQYIPLHVGFVGSNKVLNNGSSPNTLSLRITNVSNSDTITFKPGSKFTVRFDSADPSHEWGLTTVTQAQAIEIEFAGVSVPLGKNSYSDTKWSTIISMAGVQPFWEFTSKVEQSLAPNQAWVMNLKNLICTAYSGYANLYLEYQHIPGYWDGRFVALIEKGPIVYKNPVDVTNNKKINYVGIGTDTPKALLSVDLSTYIPLAKEGLPVAQFVGGHVEIGTDKNQQHLYVTGAAHVGVGIYKPGMPDPHPAYLHVGSGKGIGWLSALFEGDVQVTGGLTVSGGSLNAKKGLTVSGGSLNANAGLTVSGDSLNAKKGLTVSGDSLNANAGLTVSGGSLNANAGLTVSGGSLNAKKGLTVSGGSLNANAGLTVSGGSLNANAGLTVSGGSLNANAGLTVSGSSLNATKGLTVSGGSLNANAGLTATNLQIGGGQAFSHFISGYIKRFLTADSDPIIGAGYKATYHETNKNAHNGYIEFDFLDKQGASLPFKKTDTFVGSVCFEGWGSHMSDNYLNYQVVGTKVQVASMDNSNNEGYSNVGGAFSFIAIITG